MARSSPIERDPLAGPHCKTRFAACLPLELRVQHGALKLASRSFLKLAGPHWMSGRRCSSGQRRARRRPL
eukprot:tig00020563_g11316.t1